MRFWVLHTLGLAVEAGGLSFTAYVQPTLALVTTALVRSNPPPAITTTRVA